jgi:hypothetical protein
VARTLTEKARYRLYITRSPVWWARREAVMDRAGGICEFAGCTNKAVHVHHLTYAHLYNEPLEDLQALCQLHHKTVHVWARAPQCWCGNKVFDIIEDVVAYVAKNEYRSWNELYDNMPIMCALCMEVICMDDQLQCLSPCEDQGRQGGRSNQQVNYSGQPNGKCPTGPNTRTPMPSNSRPSRGDATPAARASDRDSDIKITWTRWPDMERLIEDEKVKWEYHESVPLSEINVPRSRANFARLGERIIQENVDAMVIQARMHRTLDLPALVAWRPEGPDGEIILNDGNHRDEFLRRIGAICADMYILCDPGPNQADTITRQANGLVGKGFTLDEKIQHAIAYFNSHPGCGYKEAATKNKISVSALTQRLRAAGLSRRFAVDGDLPVPGFVKFNDTVLVHLSKILNDTVLHHTAIQLLTVRGFGYKNAERLQKVVKETKPTTEEAQLAAVNAEIARQRAEKASEAGPQRGPASKQNALIRATRQLLRLLEATFTLGVSAKDVFDMDHRAEYLELAKQTSTIQRKVEKGLS